MNIFKLFKNVTKLGKKAKANPYIALGAVAIAGVTSVAVSGVRAGRRIERNVIKARADKKAPLSKKEHLKIVAKCAWITALLALLTGSAIFASVHIAHNKIKKLTMAYTAATALLEAHEQAELIKGGTDLAREIKDEVFDSEGLPEANEQNIINKRKSDSDDLWYDLFTGFYFWATQDKIDHLRESIYNYMALGDATCELTYLFDFLDYDARRLPKYANDWRFEIEDTLCGCDYASKVRIKEGVKKDVNGKAILTIDYYDICKYCGTHTSIPFIE